MASGRTGRGGARSRRVRKKLQALRVERGLKQSDIAEQLCVSTAAVSQWESGRMVPREERWRELADCLGVGITDLTSNQSTSDLRQLISASRAEIAQAAGIEPANVRILLDM
ncbi:MAG: helix-turn-helix domain-containing protein [Alphaproteobacteria bacterium]|nr:helix-turn-helix domain-containing protein [Alphaproteobacteria bacterium]